MVEDYLDFLEHDAAISTLLYGTGLGTVTGGPGGASNKEIPLEVLTHSWRARRHKRPGGRKKKKDTQVLDKFIPFGKKKLKKEYLRVQMIRGHKKANRTIAKKCSRQLNRFHNEDPNKNKIWQKMAEIFGRNPKLFKNISDTKAGPKTDGKAKKETDPEELKSFNKEFCQKYFADSLVRESYYFYSELTFLYNDPNLLKEVFRASCCESVSHNDECYELWSALKQFLQTEIILELDLPPYVCDEQLSPTTQEFSNYLSLDN